MSGKRFLKRLVFGELQNMPPEINPGQYPPAEIKKLNTAEPARDHLVIYCEATLGDK